MKTTSPLRTTLVFACLLSATGAMAEPDLILQTEPEETIIPLSGNAAIDNEGNIITTPVDTKLVCSSSSTETLCEDVLVSTDVFRVNGASEATVNQGESILFEWDSRGAWACEGFDFPGWTGTAKPPNDASVRIDTDNVSVGTYDPGLVCKNGSVEGEILTAKITVEETSSELTHCTDRAQLPSTWKQRTYGSNSCIFTDSHTLDTSKDCRFFDGIWPADWPGTSNQRVLNLGPGNGGREYVAIKFNSGNISADENGQISFNSPQTGGLVMNKLHYAISTCPGDFDKPAVDKEMGLGCYEQKEGRFNLNWGGSDWTGNEYVCGLQANTDYYLNILYSESPSGTVPSDLKPIAECTEGNGCGHRVTP